MQRTILKNIRLVNILMGCFFVFLPKMQEQRSVALNQGSLTASNTEDGLCIQIRLPLSK